MNNYRPFAGITPAVKIIIIINVLVFLAVNMIGQRSDVDLVNILGMHLPQSQYFQIYQYITHMFTQEGLTHLFFNMFAVFMFGRILESVWGTKRFIIYYFVTGLGAAALHSLVSWYGLHNMQEQFYAFQSTPDAGVFAEFVRSHVSNPRLLSQLMLGMPHLPVRSLPDRQNITCKVLFRPIPTFRLSGHPGLSSAYCWHSVCCSRTLSYT